MSIGEPVVLCKKSRADCSLRDQDKSALQHHHRQTTAEGDPLCLSSVSVK